MATREMDKVYMQVFEREREREVCFDSLNRATIKMPELKERPVLLKCPLFI